MKIASSAKVRANMSLAITEMLSVIASGQVLYHMMPAWRSSVLALDFKYQDEGAREDYFVGIAGSAIVPRNDNKELNEGTV